MIYKYDEPMIFPVRDLYDSGMMQSYLSAVQRQYEQSREDQKEFIKNFGDYISPWNTANKAWYDETMGKVSDMMNAAAAQGIDLTRSQEGRALLGNLMRNVDYAKLAGLKEAAKAGEMYQKAKQDAILKGTWNEDRERWALERAGLPSFEEYDPNIHGIWTRTAPAKFTTLFDATNPWFEGMKEGALTQKQVEDLGFKYDPNYDWTGVSKERMRDVILQNTPGWMTSEDALYYYDVAKRELQALGNANPTSQQIQARLNENIETANNRVPYAKYKANDFALKEQDFRNDVALQNLKHRQAKELKDYENNNNNVGERKTYVEYLRENSNLQFTDNVLGNIDRIRSSINRNSDLGKVLNDPKNTTEDKLKYLVDNGYVNNNGPTSKLRGLVSNKDSREILKAYRNDGQHLSPNTLFRQIKKMTDRYMTKIDGTNARSVVKRWLYGSDANVNEESADAYGKTRKVQVDNDVYLSTIGNTILQGTPLTGKQREMRVANVHVKFNDHIRSGNVELYDSKNNNNIKAGFISRGGTQLPGTKREYFVTQGDVYISKKDFDAFVNNELNSSTSRWNKEKTKAEDVAKTLGLKKTKFSVSKRKSSTTGVVGYDEYETEGYIVPITKISNDYPRELDVDYNKQTIGTSNTYKDFYNVDAADEQYKQYYE